MESVSKTKGRIFKEKEDNIAKDPFLNDYIKITQSGAYRRLAFKTQVLSMPDNPHVRTRLVHTEEVIGISMVIAENLGLNMNICMAIAAGHDVGHTPYGHLGEKILSKLSGKKFRHNVNSMVVAQDIERRGKGLNLTPEVLDGILSHSFRYKAKNRKKTRPQEYAAVMWADKIAYTFSDLNDGIRYGYLSKKDIPAYAYKLGKNQRQRVSAVINALIEESKEKGYVSLTKGDIYEHFMNLRRYLIDNFYKNVDLSLQEQYLKTIYRFIRDSSEFEGVDPVIAVSLLTDREVDRFANLLAHSVKPTLSDLKHFGLIEILPFIKNRKINYENPDLSWIE
ncbi:MAG: HD domain-containing protein [Nanoarchaeota archaeon]